MHKHVDRRIRRTNHALAEALIALTSEQPYPSIQVRDITDRADVGYATFYRHYDSKDDLMLSIFEEIIEELETSAGEQGEGYFEREGSLVFEHVQKYHALYANIVQNQAFVKQLKSSLANRIEDHISSHFPMRQNPALPIELVAHHMAGSLVNLIEWWLDHGMQLPIQAMAEIYQRLIIRATWFALADRHPGLDGL